MIEVTQEDIDQGQRAEIRECAIALALNRTFDSHYSVVSPTFFSVGTWFAKLPKAAREFVRKFDAGERVKPFCFALPMRLRFEEPPDIPKEVHAQLAKEQLAKIAKKLLADDDLPPETKLSSGVCAAVASLPPQTSSLPLQ